MAPKAAGARIPLERKGKGREPRSVNLSCPLLGRLCGVLLFGSPKPSTAVSSVAEWIHSRLHLFLLSKKRTSERALSQTRWQISAVSSCKHHRRPKTLHLPTFQTPPSPVRPHSAEDFQRGSTQVHASILARDKRRDGRWRRDPVRGEKLRGAAAAAHSSAAPPLQPAARGETNSWNIT